GKAFTSKDVATTYWVGRLASYAIWNFIDKIETPDDLTVRFHYSKPTSLGERLILRNQVKPDSVYGALAKKAQDFYGGGGTNSTGPALYFHWENAPQFQDKRLRQAVAMAFNREEAGKIFYGSSARAPKYMAGFSDGLVANWVNTGDQSKLNAYSFDTAKAD